MCNFFSICVSVHVHLTVCTSKVVSEVLGGKEWMEKKQIVWLETFGV